MYSGVLWMFWMIFSSITDVGSMWIFVETDNGFSTCFVVPCGMLYAAGCIRLSSVLTDSRRRIGPRRLRWQLRKRYAVQPLSDD